MLTTNTTRMMNTMALRMGRGRVEERTMGKNPTTCWRTYEKLKRKEGAKQEPVLCLVGR
jgi:hypothetical protein